jgi:glycosyltransferase involved in cell wall biosynthesis
MTQQPKTLLYGTNVFHYEHVLMAMCNESSDVTLTRRSEIDDSISSRLEKLPLPPGMLSMLKRRTVHRTIKAPNETTFGLEQYIHPINRILGKKTSRHQYRFLTLRMAQRVAQEADGKSHVHFVEGLGHLALRRRQSPDQVFICERRGVHPATWENPREPLYDMPVRFREDPIRDMLESEFAASDKIVVYSNAAKATFIKQGFKSSKIQVLPLPIPPLQNPLPLKRRKAQILFVGRGDLDKGIDVAVSVMEQLGSPYELVVTGPFSPEMSNWLAKFPFVKYIGPSDKTTLQKLYAESTALLLPSIESFGFVLIEAVNAGLPVICSDQTGASEYVKCPLVATVGGFDPSLWAKHTLELIDRINIGQHLDGPFFNRLSFPNVVKDWRHLYT